MITPSGFRHCEEQFLSRYSGESGRSNPEEIPSISKRLVV